jgi:hypothetical protein
MKRFLRIFALLVAASMLLWIAGCGDDDDDDDDTAPPAALVSTIPDANGSQPGNSAVTFTFDAAMASATVTGATGTVSVAGMNVVFTPTEPYPSGSTTLSLSGKDANDNDVTASLTYTAEPVDLDPPVLDGPSCVPPDAATGVDPAGMTELVIAANEDLSDAKVKSTDPEFNFTDKVEGKLVTLTFLQWSPPNETTLTVELDITDLAGNTATVTYSFTTMAKEE